MQNDTKLDLNIDELKKQLAYYSKQKDDLTADVFRIEGILMFLICINIFWIIFLLDIYLVFLKILFLNLLC